MSVESVDADHEAFTFEDIEWTGNTILKDQAATERNLDFMRTLLTEGTATDFRDNDTAHNLPYRYNIKGVSVKFYPH